MRRLNILHLTTFLQGGAGRAIVDLACAQRAAGHRVTVVTSHTGQGGYANYPEYLEYLRAAGLSVHACDSLFTRDLTLNMRVVDMLSRLEDPKTLDVIHAHAAVPAFIGGLYAAGARPRVPIIQTQHGWGTSKTPQQAAFDIDILRQVDRIVTTSSATADLLVGFGAPAAAITVIPCGLVATDDGPPVEEPTLLALRAAGVPLVGCIGSVTANKNQTLLVDALLVTEHSQVTAVFVGEGSETLVEHARVCDVDDRVITYGYQPQASRWLPLFDLLVLPSKSEGQGLVVLEAFRAGVPVVASDIPALVELVDEGRYGLLFEEDSAIALATTIDQALAMPAGEREAMVSAARFRFASEFTLDRMVERHDALYRQVSVSTVDSR